MLGMDTPGGHVYVLGPIDWWPAWTSLDAPLVEEFASESDRAGQRQQLEALLEYAKARFREAGWEGDVRMGPFFAGLPTDDVTGEVMVGLKQGNNGTTFIWSPYELPWLGNPQA
jgi:hypothetical protein